MDDVFDIPFEEKGKTIIERLTRDQAVSTYRSIGEFLANDMQGADGFDFKFVEENPLTGRERIKIFRHDIADTVTLYCRLGIYLQKRYPGSEPQSRLHEIVS